MKTTLLIPLIGFVASLCLMAADSPARDAKPTKLRHVVSFKFKATVTKEKIKEVEDAFRALKGKIPEIAGYEWGTNNSPEKHDKGFTHCFILTFKSEKDRATYLEHPDHKNFAGMLGGILEDAFVVDFWAKE